MKIGRVGVALALWVAGCGGGGEPRRAGPSPSTPAASDHGQAIRISYLHISRKAPPNTKLDTPTAALADCFLIFTSKGWMQRHGPSNSEPYAASFAHTRADYVADETMDKVVQGLTQAGLFAFPAVDPETIDPALFTRKTFRGTLVTVQTGNVRKTVAVRDPVTGRPGGDPKSAMKIDTIIEAFANYTDAAEFQTQVGPPDPKKTGWIDAPPGGQRGPSGSK